MKYKYVIPSPRTIGREKLYQAIQLDKNYALAMMDAEPEDYIAMHYDTTKQILL